MSKFAPINITTKKYYLSKQTEMGTPFHDFINNEFIPRLYENLDIAFPDMCFTRIGDKWRSPLKKDGTAPKTKNREKTVVKEKTPFLIYEGGEEPEEIIKWIVRIYGYKTTGEAVKSVCAKIGLTPPEYNNADFAKYEERKKAYQDAAKEMQLALFTPEAEPILTQLTEGRGYTIDEIQEMGLGYINSEIANKWRDRVFLPKGVEYYNQIVIPYYSAGKIEGFKFRKTKEGAVAKYINSRFSKNSYLFDLTAIPLIGNTKQDRLIILVDGELKALYMKVKGFNNVVSGAGSAAAIISDEQIRQAAQKGVQHVVIIADNESSEQERAHEKEKIVNTLKLLNKASIFGYVVYLPHEDKTKKEDVEDFLRKHSAEELRNYVNCPESGAEFRTWIILEKYEAKQVQDGELTRININNLFGELLTLTTEYSNSPTDVTLIQKTVQIGLGESAPEWTEILKKGAEAINEIKQKQRKEAEALKLSEDITKAIANKDFDGVLALAAQAQQILTDDKSAEFAPMFAPRRWSETTDKLKRRKIGIETLYLLKRKNESDLLTLPNGALTIIAAPTNHGKSTMLQNLALQAAQDPNQQGAILYLTFEEDVESVSVQFLSKVIGKAISRDNKRSIKSYYLGDEKYITDLEAFEAGEKKMKELIESGKLWINGTESPNGVSVDRLTPLKRLITQATKEIKRGVAAVFVDYVQLIQPDERIKNRAEELKVICTELKNLAVKLELPIILAAQFSREGSKSPYELEAESIGEGGDIERAAAVIVGLWNTSKKPRQNALYKQDDKIYRNEDSSRNFQITFDENHPQIYLRLLKSRGEATGGEALLNCDLNVGIIKPNISRQEIAQLHSADMQKPKQEKSLYTMPF